MVNILNSLLDFLCAYTDIEFHKTNPPWEMFTAVKVWQQSPVLSYAPKQQKQHSTWKYIFCHHFLTLT